ncbi:hypothetical protein KA005_61765 [bacterium]|nr:hypothetical protein [bacterium]
MIKKSICMNCGKIVVYPSVDPITREVVCNGCKKIGLIKIPQHELKPVAKRVAA